jgi:hypothetical protein
MMEMDMKHLVERELAGETEVLRGSLLQFHFVHHKFHLGSKPATNRLRYGTAQPTT